MMEEAEPGEGLAMWTSSDSLANANHCGGGNRHMAGSTMLKRPFCYLLAIVWTLMKSSINMNNTANLSNYEVYQSKLRPHHLPAFYDHGHTGPDSQTLYHCQYNFNILNTFFEV